MFNQATSSSYKLYLWDNEQSVPYRTQKRYEDCEFQGNAYKKYLHGHDHNIPQTSAERACNIPQDEHHDASEEIYQFDCSEDEQDSASISDDEQHGASEEIYQSDCGKDQQENASNSDDEHHDALEDIYQSDCGEDQQDTASISDDEHHDSAEETYQFDSSEDQQDNASISDDDESFAANNDDSPVYAGSKITVAQSLLLLIYFIMRHNITKACVQDLLTLINFHAPQGQDPVPSTVHMLYRTLKLSGDDVQKHFFCPSCQSYLGKLQDRFECRSCNSDYTAQNLIIEKAFFLTLPVKQQLKDKLKDPEFVSNIDYKWKRKKQDHNNIEDIFDGEMYKSVKPLNDPLRNDLSLSWNTDGSPIFKSSNFSMWPIQCTVNELPPKLRKKHRLLPGLWVGKTKPSMGTFLRPFVEECVSLETEGISWISKDMQEKCSKVFTLLSICDSPARCLVQNVKQFNGEYGCNWCYAKGEQVERGLGTARVYPVQKEPANKRTHDSMIADGLEASKGQLSHKGVKGLSPLLAFTYFNMVSGFGVDYMHCVLLGVCRQLFSLWFDTEYHREPWYLSRRIAEIDSWLLSITPPKCILRMPRSLTCRKYWKASEIKNFLLYYSVACLKNILPTVYLKHYLLLVHGMYTLLKSSVSTSEICQAHFSLITFHRQFQSLYGISHMTYNLHLLTHISQCVVDWGPLWVSSAFSFEDGNRILLNLFHGTTGIPSQITSNVQLIQCLPRIYEGIINRSMSEDYEKFIHKLSSGHTQAATDQSATVTFLGVAHVHMLSPREKTLLEGLVDDALIPDSCLEYSKAIVGGNFVAAKGLSFSGKSSNFCFELFNGDVFLIKRILAIRSLETCLLIGYPVVPTNEQVVPNMQYNIKLPWMFACQEEKSKVRVVLPVELKQPVVLFQNMEGFPSLMCCHMSSTHESS